MKSALPKIAIIGHGIVGRAVDHGFPRAEKFIVDPIRGTSVSELAGFAPDFAFICVPTPMGADGRIDASALADVMGDIAGLPQPPLVVVKSTATPAVLAQLCRSNAGLRIVYNPEFLTERNHLDDFVHPRMIVLGGDRADVLAVRTLYETFSSVDAPFVECDVAAAAMLKYTINCFLAMKVSYFNQVNEVFGAVGTGMSWSRFIDALSLDPRMGTSHMNVPGHDGERGWGLGCFPKDTRAFIHQARDVRVDLTILEEAVHYNDRVRAEPAVGDGRVRRRA